MKSQWPLLWEITRFIHWRFVANEPRIYVAYMQAFVSTLTPAQCNQLIIQAYSNTEGFELAKSVGIQ